MKNHLQTKVMIIDPIDKQVWDLMADVPYVSKPVAGVSAVVNLLFPGFGTVISACAGSETVSKTQLSIALFQFLTAVFIIGWVWAQYWSYLIVMKSINSDAAI